MNIVMYTHELKLEYQKDLTCLYKEMNNVGFVCSPINLNLFNKNIFK